MITAEMMIAGHANEGVHKFKQLTGTAVYTGLHCYGFIPVNGDATFTTLKNAQGDDMTGDIGGGTAYQNMWYPGSYEFITLATGTIIAYLSKD